MLTKKQRVIKALSVEFSLWDEEELDDFARELLAIPPRPEGNEPFGWLLPQNNDDATMGISEAGINLIKKWEGFRGSAYLDPVGIWTIGYGHTKGVQPGQVISESEALNLLKSEVKTYEDAVRRLVTVPLSQGQFDALTSFCYNTGIGALSQSTLLRYLNEEDYKAAADQFLRWVYGAGRVLPGLVSRRQHERRLFLS